MKTFKVYKHPTKNFEAVKIGFSWPAFFFGIIWMLVKKLWGFAGIWFLLYFFAAIASAIADNAGIEPGLQLIMYFLLLGAYLALWLIPGIKGNGWRVKNLEKRGYEIVREVQAESPDAAVAQVSKSDKFMQQGKNRDSKFSDSPLTNIAVEEQVREKIDTGSEVFRWQCPRCCGINSSTLFKCSCGYIIGLYEQEKYRFNQPIEQHIVYVNWKCPRCSRINDKALFKCSCGYIIGPKEQAKYAIETATERYKDDSMITKYYQILEVKPGISKEDIKQAYKDLLDVWNPTKYSDNPSLQKKAQEKITEIDEAYEQLILYFSRNPR